MQSSPSRSDRRGAALAVGRWLQKVNPAGGAPADKPIGMIMRGRSAQGTNGELARSKSTVGPRPRVGGLHRDAGASGLHRGDGGRNAEQPPANGPTRGTPAGLPTARTANRSRGRRASGAPERGAIASASAKAADEPGKEGASAAWRVTSHATRCEGQAASKEEAWRRADDIARRSLRLGRPRVDGARRCGCQSVRGLTGLKTRRQMLLRWTTSTDPYLRYM